MRWQSQKNQREREREWERATEQQREREGRGELSLSCQGQSISNATIRITTRGRATPPCSWAAPNQMLSWRNKNTRRLKTEDRYGGYMWRASRVLSSQFAVSVFGLRWMRWLVRRLDAKGERGGGRERQAEKGRDREESWTRWQSRIRDCHVAATNAEAKKLLDASASTSPLPSSIPLAIRSPLPCLATTVAPPTWQTSRNIHAIYFWLIFA